MSQQNFQNHTRIEPLFHVLTFGLLAINLVRAGRAAWPFSAHALPDLSLAIALVLLAWFTRVFPLKAQDRVIRLEERLRVRELAPQLAVRFDALPIAQVTALRFASDAEFPALLQKVLDGKLSAPNDIKAAIQNWRADELRV